MKGKPLRSILHSIAAVWPPLTLAYIAASILAANQYAGGPVSVSCVAVLAMAFFSWDAGARLLEYQKARDLLTKSRHSNKDLAVALHKLAVFHQGSFCRRTALAWAAVNALGPNGRQIVSIYYGAIGYRWYHLTPDNAFTRHSPLLKVAFWRDLLGLGRRAQA